MNCSKTINDMAAKESLHNYITDCQELVKYIFHIRSFYARTLMSANRVRKNNSLYQTHLNIHHSFRAYKTTLLY